MAAALGLRADERHRQRGRRGAATTAPTSRFASKIPIQTP